MQEGGRLTYMEKKEGVYSLRSLLRKKLFACHLLGEEESAHLRLIEKYISLRRGERIY